MGGEEMMGGQAVKDRLTVQRGNLTYSGGAKYLWCVLSQSTAVVRAMDGDGAVESLRALLWSCAVSRGGSLVG